MSFCNSSKLISLRFILPSVIILIVQSAKENIITVNTLGVQCINYLGSRRIRIQSRRTRIVMITLLMIRHLQVLVTTACGLIIPNNSGIVLRAVFKVSQLII